MECCLEKLSNQSIKQINVIPRYFTICLFSVSLRLMVSTKILLPISVSALLRFVFTSQFERVSMQDVLNSENNSLTVRKDMRFAVAVFFDDRISCTGFLLNPSWVLAPSGCFGAESGVFGGVMLGPRVGDEKAARQVDGYEKTAWIYDHPLRLAGDESYGFVLLELGRRVPVADYLANPSADYLIPVTSYEEPLRERSEAAASTRPSCEMIGHDLESSEPDDLRVIPVGPYPRDRCRKYHRVVPQLHVCAEFDVAADAELPDGCVDMEGALLVCDNKLVGLQTRWNKTCGVLPSAPVLFLRVDHTEGFRRTVIESCVGVGDCFWNRRFGP